MTFVIKRHPITSQICSSILTAFSLITLAPPPLINSILNTLISEGFLKKKQFTGNKIQAKVNDVSTALRSFSSLMMRVKNNI